MSTRAPLLPFNGSAVPPPRRSSKPTPRRSRTWMITCLCILSGFVLWLLMRRELPLEDLRRTANDRSSEWLSGIADRLLSNEHQTRTLRTLTSEEIEKMAEIPWLEEVLEPPGRPTNSSSSMNASESVKPPPIRPETTTEQFQEQHIKPTIFVPETASFDKLAIAVKTGSATALQRVPVQAATFLRHVKQWMLIGEAPGIVVGERAVIDVFSDLYTDPPYPDHLGKHADHGGNGTFYKSPKMKLGEKAGKGRRRLARRHQDEHRGKDAKDAIVPDNSAVGWKKDAHKNLPGFIHLWNSFPNAEWYFMIDDDTYLFLENVMRAVEGLNPDNAYYFGTPTLFVGCDGVTEYGDGPQFAHGGSGIMMSRGSLIRMLSIANRCIDKYHDCWAGDVRTALCLRDAGIKLQGHRGLTFHNEPPNSKSWWPEDPCSRPTTFHHLLLPQIQKLYDTDRLQLEQGEPTSYGHIFTNFLTDKERKDMSTRVDNDINRQGMDYRHEATPSPEACANLCAEEARCKAWTWEKADGDGGECWFKKGIPSKQEKKGATSGVVPKNYMC